VSIHNDQRHGRNAGWGRVTSSKGHWFEGLWLRLGLGAECLCKFNETPKSRTSTLFMHGVPVCPFRYGMPTSATTTVGPVTLRTSDQYPAGLLRRRTLLPLQRWCGQL